jgi:hypothetical protein
MTYRRAKSRNYFWSKENAHFFHELENDPPHMIIRTAMSAKHLFGPYFFEGPVNQGTYHIMGLVCASGAFRIAWTCMVSLTWCPGSLRNRHVKIPQRSVQRQVDWPWIRAFTSASGVATPKPGSVFLWQCTMGVHQTECCQKWYKSPKELKEAIWNAFASITPAMLHWFSHCTWRQIILCHENAGAYTNTLE